MVVTEEETVACVSWEEEAVEPEMAKFKLKMFFLFEKKILWICSWIATRALETRVMAVSIEVTWVVSEVFSVSVQVTEALEISLARVEIFELEGKLVA